jgi:hypothetical protein
MLSLASATGALLPSTVDQFLVTTMVVFDLRGWDEFMTGAATPTR